MEKIAIIVPSRGRPQLIRQLMSSWMLTSNNNSVIIMGLDGDDPTLSDYPPGIHMITTPQQELNEKNNYLANYAVDRGHEIIGCLSDDFVFLTSNWEDKVISCQESLKGICYGDDLLQGRALPTAPFIHRDIILPLGYAAPPVLKHYYIDNYWLELGMRLDRLQYIPNMCIEHKHWSAGKAAKDETYSKSEALMAQDRAAWDYYREHQLAEDVEKIQQFKTL
jgi:GT2 family glycosyltransferase